MKDILFSYAEYNLWANKRIAEVLKSLDDDMLDKVIPSSFSSFRKTAFHIWDAEYIWLMRVQELAATGWPSKLLPEKAPVERFAEVSHAWVEFLRGESDSFFTLKIAYQNTKGEPFESLRSEMIHHCFNHSTFHRGQIVTMLHASGYTERIPPTDQIAFFREK